MTSSPWGRKSRNPWRDVYKRQESIPRFISSKHNPDSVSYKHPSLVPILSNTYGCIVYQEQVIEIFRRLAGYSLGQADMVRRAMSKKKMKDIQREREAFLLSLIHISLAFISSIGAPVSAMELMNAKAEKLLRNGVNRRVNCEAANVDKTVDAALEQRRAIQILRDRGALETLSPKLREAAQLREAHPEPVSYTHLVQNIKGIR